MRFSELATVDALSVGREVSDLLAKFSFLLFGLFFHWLSLSLVRCARVLRMRLQRVRWMFWLVGCMIRLLEGHASGQLGMQSIPHISQYIVDQ